MKIALLSSALLLLAGCQQNTPLMTPGEDCLHCHGAGRGRFFSVAGTLYPSLTSRSDEGLVGAIVQVRDATGEMLSLETNAAGNFYSDQRVQFPLTVDVQLDGQTRHMEPSVSYGGCSRCHNVPPTEGAEGWVYITPSSP